MLRRVELWLMLAVTVAMFAAAMIGRRVAPSSSLLDERRSAELSGPFGAKGLAEALTRLGMVVELRHRPLFDWGSQDLVSQQAEFLALLDVSLPLTQEEQRRLRNGVARGHSLLLVGVNGVERCFGYRVRYLDRSFSDSGAVLVTAAGIGSLPAVDAVMEPIPVDSLAEATESSGCSPLLPTQIDTLASTVDGEMVAAILSFRPGSTVILIADSWLVSNRALRETDAGLLVLPWLLDSGLGHIEIAEYHHGFQDRKSVFAAAWSWMRRSPLGWLILQLSVAALLVLGLVSIRFGPALAVVERKRRSALEHLDALAIGLQRAQGSNLAVNLIAEGLRRRLTRSGTVQLGRKNLSDWLATLALAVHTTDARRKVKRLSWLVREPGGDEQVLSAAAAVEDVWEALGQQKKQNRS